MHTTIRNLSICLSLLMAGSSAAVPMHATQNEMDGARTEQSAIRSYGRNMRFTLEGPAAPTKIELIDLHGFAVAVKEYTELVSGVLTLRFSKVAAGQYICNVYRNGTKITGRVVLR